MKIQKKKIFLVSNYVTRLISIVVLVNGLFIIAATLIRQLLPHRFTNINVLSIDISLLVGVSLIYLSTLLQRRKRNAFFATILAYAFYLGTTLENLNDLNLAHHINLLLMSRSIIIPVLVLVLLAANYKKYVVRSDAQSFKTALKISLVVLIAVLLYGTIGYKILGSTDFHQNLSYPAAAHYTIDQLNITTNHPLTAYSRQGRLFQDSLTLVSLISIIYILLSFFQPIREKLSEHSLRFHFMDLLEKQHDARSEDFFKVWPKDKHYFFDSSTKSGLAYRVSRGNALVLGDPTGKKARFRQLLSEFNSVCYGNDWRVAFIHVEDNYLDLYKEFRLKIQLIGQEAVVDIDNFLNHTKTNKYFRNIINKFKKSNYSYEFVKPPHSRELLTTLQEISNDWLTQGGHVERGFAMGYFDDEYLNMCNVLLVRNEHKEVVAFINMIPADFDKQEATYDLLRYKKGCLSNTNDFVLISFMDELKHLGYKSLNMGLCPLAGLDSIKAQDKESTFIDGLLRFAYSNGDRFYSFRGLLRFKSKYEPTWRNRYIVYSGGIRGFARVNNALMRIMRNSYKHRTRRLHYSRH